MFAILRSQACAGFLRVGGDVGLDREHAAQHCIGIRAPASLAPAAPSWVILNMFLHLSVSQFVMHFHFLSIIVRTEEKISKCLVLGPLGSLNE